MEAQIQEARHLEDRLGEETSKLEAELTESQSSLAYITTKLHATETSRTELDRKLQDAHSRLKASETTLSHLKDKVAAL